MKVNNKELGFIILPSYGSVEAEIYLINNINGFEYHERLISKSFGSIFRDPIDKDYINANKWVKSQLLNIQESNKI